MTVLRRVVVVLLAVSCIAHPGLGRGKQGVEFLAGMTGCSLGLIASASVYLALSPDIVGDALLSDVLLFSVPVSGALGAGAGVVLAGSLLEHEGNVPLCFVGSALGMLAGFVSGRRS